MYTDADSLADVRIIVRNIQKQRAEDLAVALVVDDGGEESGRVRTHLLDMRVVSYPYVRLFRAETVVVSGGLFDRDTRERIARELKK